jgi:general secretion pathway protein E
MDMGVEDYLITAVVNGIVAQRLVRRLCPHCRAGFVPSAAVIDRLGIAPLLDAAASEPQLFRAVGCDQCHGTGYRGREAIYEVLVMTDALRALIMAHAQAAELQRAAVGEGMQPIYRNGARKALAGITTMEEVIRVSSNL